jgi:beta-lactamase class A
MRTALAALSAMFILATPVAPAQAAPETAQATSFAADITSLSKAGAGSAGSVGVAAWRLDGKGPVTLVNADVAYPMASTFKVAVAGAVLKRVEDGQLKLDQMISIDLAKMVDSEVLQDRFIHPGLSVSVYNLLELMLTESDNTATDYMVEAAGGPAAVTAWVKAQGVTGLRVDGGTDALIRRWAEMGPGPFHEASEAQLKSDPNIVKRDGMPYPPFDNDPRDTSTPRAMATLLTRIYSGKALKPESTKILIGMMERCRTGAARLRGLMPEDTTVAHKTGTIGGTINDVGVITLPGGAGQVVVAVFIKASDAPRKVRERTIAEIGRSVRDYYLHRGSN